ncbi:peptidase [Sandaracinobacteroides saxicola]|uniref:Peptidase n=1 Tax=Sandaracinobacteroides saxicola TaxID=2759707 RepID=A0A7G5IIX7_9SPHN|nr:peptidase [Sandaracinobacteroides saxicola]QMW23319.1 peptidase [Sandaracinobacteroides saxicola]
MTYCMGLLVKEGLVMLADTRTNAGIDNVNVYRKLRVYGEPGKRIIGIAASGSLSTTQAAINRLQEGVHLPGDPDTVHYIETAPTMFKVAQIVGVALAEARSAIESTVNQADVSIDVTLLVGGSIGGAAPRLFLVYPEGNCIECGMDTPYLQIGENKYGKPILDRLLSYRTGLAEAVKIGLISMNSTMRSNLAVGLPIDMLVLRPGQSVAATHRIAEDDPYYMELGARWLKALREAQADIPAPPYALP